MQHILQTQGDLQIVAAFQAAGTGGSPAVLAAVARVDHNNGSLLCKSGGLLCQPRRGIEAHRQYKHSQCGGKHKRSPVFHIHHLTASYEA